MISTPNELELIDDEENVYRPSPARIALVCAVIRRKWTDREFRKRSTQTPRSWSVPIVSVDLEPSEISAE